MELSIRINEHPGLTNLIGKLKKDDELKVKAPFGMFVLREEDKKRIFVATGTGLAPMISYLRAMKGKFIPTTLFFGCHSETTFFFQEELEELSKKEKKFELKAIASAPSKKSLMRKGFVQELIREHNFSGSKDDYGIYISGTPAICDPI